MNMRDIALVREALANISENPDLSEKPNAQVYLPPSHANAVSAETKIITGMSGAGKTFWWNALQYAAVRDSVGRAYQRIGIDGSTEVRTGFGALARTAQYPDTNELRSLLAQGLEPKHVWRTVLASLLADGIHPLLERQFWTQRVNYVVRNPSHIDALFREKNSEFERRDVRCLILFDALDRCAYGWHDMRRVVRGILHSALEIWPYKRILVKMFMRSDQVDDLALWDFPDATKILSSVRDLQWSSHMLDDLLWHSLARGRSAVAVRRFISAGLGLPEDSRWISSHFALPSWICADEFQARRFDCLTGFWLGDRPEFRFDHKWALTRLADTRRRVSPASFLAVLRTAARDSMNRYPDHPYPLHRDSIWHGVRAAMHVRVGEVQEEYPWVDSVLDSLKGMQVPLQVNEIKDRWIRGGILERIRERAEQLPGLPPRRFDRGADGLLSDLEGMGIIHRLRDGRLNIPDVFRIPYGLGRSGGVVPRPFEKEGRETLREPT